MYFKKKYIYIYTGYILYSWLCYYRNQNGVYLLEVKGKGKGTSGPASPRWVRLFLLWHHYWCLGSASSESQNDMQFFDSHKEVRNTYRYETPKK